MNLEHKFQVNFPNHNLPKMLCRVGNEITKISRSFSTLTLYTQKLTVANAHIKNFFSINSNQLMHISIFIKNTLKVHLKFLLPRHVSDHIGIHSQGGHR